MINNLIKNVLSNISNNKKDLRIIRSDYLYHEKDDIEISNRIFRLIDLLQVVESDLKDLKNKIEK